MHYPRVTRRAPLLAAAVALAASLLLWLPSAMAEGGSVRFSYERVSVAGNDQYVLVPRAETSLSTKGRKLSKGNVIKAFNTLKGKKSGSYGNAKIRIGSGRWPDRARVKVTIDPQYARYYQIVMAEVVYTLTELGLEGVEFPGYADGLVTRSDIPFLVYTLTVPVWQAVSNTDIEPAQIMMPDGTTEWAPAFYKRWKGKDPEIVEALYSYLESPNRDTIVYVLRSLPPLGIPYTDQTLPLLSHDSVGVRREALKVLANKRNQNDVLGAVAARLEKEDDHDTAVLMANFLGEAKDDAFAIRKPLWFLDNAKETSRSIEAAEALTKYSDDDRATEALFAKLSHKEQTLAEASAQALAKMDKDAAQIRALSEKKIPMELRLSIARDMSEDKETTTSIKGYTFLAEQAGEREAVRAIEALAQMKSNVARGVAEGFLDADVDWRRRAASRALAQREDPASIPAFAKAIRAIEDDRKLEEDGYEVMVAQPLETIMEYTKNSNNIIQRLAYRAIGQRAVQEKAGRQVMDVLKAGASNPDPLIRGASARALGAFANDTAASTLKGITDDKSAAVRRDVALAIGQFDGAEMVDTLVAYLDDKDPGVVAAAIDSLGKRKQALAWDRIKGYTDSDNPQIRAAALRGLARLTSRDDDQTVKEVVSILSGALNADAKIVRQRAIEQLGTFESRNAVITIASQLQDKDVDIRVTALHALGETGHSSATKLITNALDDPTPKVRRAAVEALGTLGDKGARDELQARLDKETDDELKGLMRETLKQL